MDALPRRRALGLAGDVPVPVSLEAGRMRLSVNELSSLEPDDVLLPETYPAREGRVTLRLCATSRSLAFACSLAEGCATILSVLNPEEGPMSDENNTAAGAAPSEGVDTGELEVTLTFELERRLMTVRDVETLAPATVGWRCARPGHAVRQRKIRRQGAPCGRTGRSAYRSSASARWERGQTGVNPLYFIVGMALLGLVCFFLMMVTSYVKIVVVTSLVRNALGVQQVPPAMVMNGLAIILSLFIMAPMMMSTMDIAEKLQISAEPSPKEVIGIVDKLSPPLRKFLSDNTEDGVLRAFMSTAKRIWPKEQHDQISKDNMLILVPAFTISELTKAFQVGFLLYLPFIAIDLIISNILLAMGMMMVSPMTISLPFKLLLFVTLDGWLKISQGLLLSYK
ncbi:MAG: type III secretion system export apparatus subunit SctR [Bilophila wadsworthia]